ncbi:MAG: sugar nucleotide-binding protein [Planctomycetota bacterium]
MHAHRILLSGMRGTVAPALALELQARGFETLAWDRALAPPEDDAALVRTIADSGATAVVHCAMGDPVWAERMAACCGARGIRFLYTSSVSVFGARQQGPFEIDAVPEPSDDYGRYKLECERRVLAAFPGAQVVRLGWQMSLRAGGNQMTEHLSRQQSEHGHVAASTGWFQACSFLEDTARVLAEVLGRFPPGLYQLDGNPGWDFHRVASALNRAAGGGWLVRPAGAPRLNNLMCDPRLPSASIERLLEPREACENPRSA